MEKKTAQSQVFLFVREPDVGGILSAVLEINKLKLQKSISPSLSMPLWTGMKVVLIIVVWASRRAGELPC